jgi:hypothetical protein
MRRAMGDGFEDGQDAMYFSISRTPTVRPIAPPKLGRRSQAIDLGGHAGDNPMDVDIRGMIANALAGNGQCDAASTEGARAVKDSKDNPSIAYYAAIAAAICGDRERAVLYTLKAIGGGVTADLKTNPDLAPILADPAVAKALN